MDMATATASMDMSSDMMNSHLTTNYAGYSVVFDTLKAANGGAAFGIFCVLFFTAFIFRGLAFLGAYIEQRVFVPSSLRDDDETSHEEDIEEKCCGPADSSHENTTDLIKERSTLAKFFHFTPQSLYRDFIRLILVFVSTMIGYALMLAVMSFILLYFFAVILGIAFGEIFFLRLSIVMGMRPAGTFCVALH
jgi:copper transporter 1